ncbi:MAG: CoA-binding domain protein, partial [Firmicutes bacterium]|nr:CoA-binding domain protein [Bacillota bacterium]
AESKALIAAFGIQTPRELIARDADAAVAAAAEIGGAVVLKVLAADVPHKTEAGGVALNLRTPSEVRLAYARIMASVREYKPDAAIEGVLVGEHVSAVVEMIAGVTVDPHFGPVVVAGLGGVLVEVIKDVAMRLPPFDKAEALGMLDELRGRSVLNGVRGRPAADVDALADALVRLGDMAVAMQDRLVELDLNPLFVLPAGQGVRAADALVVLKA